MSAPWLVIRPRQGAVSLKIDRRVPPVLFALALLTLAAIVFYTSFGEYPIPPLEVIKTILGFTKDQSDYNFIIYTLRLPRVFVAFAIGTGLAVSGTILQCLTHNPLAAPEIIGINAGASLAAVATLVLLPQTPLFLLPIAAFMGAMAIAFLIYSIARLKGHAPMQLILMGIGFSAIATAFTTLIVTLGNITDVSQALVWMTGSVYGRSWEHLWSLLPWLGIFLPLTWFLATDLNAFALGDDIARGLGNPLEKRRLLLWVASVALAAAAVAAAGAVAFVGFIAPHIARQFVGPGHVGLIPTAALFGGLMVVLADLLGRSLFAPIELPCGVITAVIGAPYFLYLLYKTNR